ncbi:Uncharacterised protein [Salmonella enterica subsp. enterica serovar Bovismorbificans]|uniref:Uncharacterized protein n=1 Tax=Salmonella enterica subsp. enterica serovar Bovismorbificans TaxID=58097 RepID=A0A655DYH0_SALET|nr:Uncharacterised protein [Salmonella enterica subsp. enterica serovar Bovismorbificans]
MRRFFFAARALRQHFRPTMFGAVKSQSASLDQHPAANDVIDDQQQEPDGDRGFQSRQ